MKLPKGFKPAPTPEREPLNVVEYDALRDGAILMYEGTYESADWSLLKFKTVQFEGHRRGEQVQMFGCALLNRVFEHVNKGTNVFLQYDGKRRDDKGRAVHSFTVGLQSQQVAAPASGRDEDDVSKENGDENLPF